MDGEWNQIAFSSLLSSKYWLFANKVIPNLAQVRGLLNLLIIQQELRPVGKVSEAIPLKLTWVAVMSEDVSYLFLQNPEARLSFFFYTPFQSLNSLLCSLKNIPVLLCLISFAINFIVFLKYCCFQITVYNFSDENFRFIMFFIFKTLWLFRGLFLHKYSQGSRTCSRLLKIISDQGPSARIHVP